MNGVKLRRKSALTEGCAKLVGATSSENFPSYLGGCSFSDSFPDANFSRAETGLGTVTEIGCRYRCLLVRVD